ncbi:MAG TPA: SDR family oxidoreductase [Kribbella sp.]|uniref:NAD(P)-dependent oxidoreductase n=1 Tax=Kribbella sp. TaxID=1871183 RepID=UPI002D785580|nr:SDR family oxidoreductase [Kribbella sp.]HET6294084.1 SDR family oxidoreductase [Kribbella sp.]
MKIVVFGATGPTGRQVVRQALDQGHEVTAFVRDAAKLDLRHPSLQVTVGQVTTDEDAVASAIKGQDAVISALGSERSGTPTVISQAIPRIISAMGEAGVDRVVFLSAFGVGDSYREAPLLLKVGYRLVLRRAFADKAVGERLLRDSPLDWTLVYPVLLTDGPRSGVYQVDEHLRSGRPWRISRADVADFMLAQLQDRSHIRATVVLTSGT